MISVLLWNVWLSCGVTAALILYLIWKVYLMDQEIAALQAEVTAQTTVDQSALTLIQGFGARLDAAVAAATAAGATPAQLASITALTASIKANDDALAAAVLAGTPAAPPAA